MSAPAWLQELCSTDLSRQKIAEPRSITLHGRVQTIASNGHRMMIIDADHGCPPLDADLASYVIKAHETPTRGVPLDLAAFRAFIASVVVPAPVQCEQCGGSGEVECTDCEGEGGEECECDCGDVHRRACRTCKDIGGMPCPTCKGVTIPLPKVLIGGTPFNPDYFASPPELFGDGPVMVLIDPDKERPAHFYGDGWHFIIMPLRATDAPPLGEFPLPAPVSP